MRNLSASDFESVLQEGFAAIPLNATEAAASVGVRVVVRKEHDPVSGRFVLLRQTNLATVFLGALADVEGRVREWVEIWVQRSDPAGILPGAISARTTNALLDETWVEASELFRKTDPRQSIASPYEKAHPPLVILDWATRTSSDATGDGLKLVLAQDHAELAAAGLPDFAGGRDRYARFVEGEAVKFVPLTPGAPENENTVPFSGLAVPGAIVFNKELGLLALRKFSPASLEEIAEVLGGAPWRGVEVTQKAFVPSGIYQSLQDADFLRHGDGLLFGASTGRIGRLPESLSLRLELVRQALVLAAESTRHSQLPFLNLTSDSFRVHLAAEAPGLPVLWTSTVTLVIPGEAHALPVANANGRYFQPNNPLGPSIYRPEVLTIPVRGTASIRIREVFPESRDGCVVEATFSTQERPALAKNDLVALHLPLPNGTISLFGKLDSVDGMVRGEAVFRSLPEKFTQEQVALLTSFKGVPRNQIPFEVICPLSSPTDLYSLGVLAVRLLLVNPRRALPAALDAMLSLGRELTNNPVPDLSPGQHVQKVLESHADWMAVLGPQHLLSDEFPLEEVTSRLPINLWSDVLAALTRFFPGLVSDSFCKDYGDADNLALQNIYEAPTEVLAQTCTRVRRLVFAEWRESSEIGKVIHSILDRYG